MADLHAWQDDRRAGLPIADRYVPTDPAAVIHASPAVVTVLAVAEVLRSWAALIGDVGCYWYRDESCTEPDWQAGFDVHAARHFHRRVSAAQRARAEVLAAPDRPVEPTLIDERVRARAQGERHDQRRHRLTTNPADGSAAAAGSRVVGS